MERKQFSAKHDDIQGILQTALVGVTAYTFRQYRNTGIVLPHVAENDVFSFVCQMPHRKLLGSKLDSVHIHYIPVAAADGDILINFAWGWYNIGTAVPDTLPNTGSKIISIASADQYKSNLSQVIVNLSPPANEQYSSILYVKMTRVTPAGTNWGASNEIAIEYVDAHFVADRLGSNYEAWD